MTRPFAATLGALLLAAASLAAQPPGASRATRVEPGAACPAGTTEIRPNLCQAPELPAPSILDYRPRSTLVAPEHKVPRAKFPAVDFHGHPTGALDSPEALARLVAQMDSLNLGVMVTANNTSGEALTRTLAAIRGSPAARDRVRVLTGIDFRNVGPGWAEKAVAQLEADAAAGAVGVGEIGKGLGLSIKKADGSRLRIDDPALDPVWQACARLKLPVFIHTADPQEFWQPIDNSNERWLELALFPGRRYPAEQFPSFEQLMTERDAMLRPQPEDDVRDRAHGLARQRPAAAREADDRAAQRAHRDRRGALRHRPAAARGARLLRALPGPHPLRQGLVPAGGVPVLLAGLRDARRLLRLLPPVPRVLEAVRDRPAGPGAAQSCTHENAHSGSRRGSATRAGSGERRKRRVSRGGTPSRPPTRAAAQYFARY
jgi:hypothetical protein